MPLFGRSRPDEPDTVSAAEPVTSPGPARHQLWSAVGVEEPHAVVPMFGSAIRELPRWPQRMGYCVVGTPAGGAIVATDGLSDDFVAGHPLTRDGAGFGLELFVHSHEPLTQHDAAAGWQMSLLIQAGHHAARTGDLVDRLRADTHVTIGLGDTNAPASHLDGDGRVTVLLGAVDPLVPGHLATTSGDVRLVSVVPLTPTQAHQARGGAGDLLRLANDLTARRGGALAFYGATERWTR